MLEVENRAYTMVDHRNRRLIMHTYPLEVRPQKLAENLKIAAEENNLGKIWLWAKPTDVPAFLKNGFQVEGDLFQGNYNDFTVSLAYFPERERGRSAKLAIEDNILNLITAKPRVSRNFLPRGIELGILPKTQAEDVSQLMTKVFSSYPTPVENPRYISSLMQKGCVFAGAHYQGKLISIAAAYPEPDMGRCELTDCATLAEYRGYALTEKLLLILEQEIAKRGSFTFYTLARAQSIAMNRVFYKSGYRYRGRLVNNCHIAGSYQDMNLWINMKTGS
jgi:putative beta-lysine N-acetyltransferase